MPDIPRPTASVPAVQPLLPPTPGLGQSPPETEMGRESPPVAHRVGWGFISLYALAYIGTILLFLAPLLVSLALKVNTLVGIERAPNNLALVAGVGALLAMFANPFFGRLSDRTSSRLGMRRPWMVIGLAGGSLGVLVVAVAPSIAVVLIGWCIAQLFFNALLASLVAVLPDQVPVAQLAEERVGEHGEQRAGPGDQRQAVGCSVDTHERVDLQRQADQQGREEQQDGADVGQRVQRDEPPPDSLQLA